VYRQKIQNLAKVMVCSIIGISLIGCGEGLETIEDADTALDVVSRNDKFEILDKPACEVDFADYEIDSHLLAFEIYTGGNISIGYNLLSGFLKAIGLNFSMKSGKMIMSMHAEETLRPNASLADVMGEANSVETNLSLNINALQLGGEIGYFYKTPLAKLTEKTIKSAMGNLRNDLSKIETAWRSKIVWQNGGYEFIIPAGKVAGIRVGDQFAIYDIDYIWMDKPCESELLFARKTTDNPLKVLEVVQLEKHSALMRVKQSFTDEEISIGAIVEPFLLPAAKKETRVLARAARIKEVKSEKFKVEGAPDIDIALYLREQLESLLNEFNMYARK
jgi:hypothetical protein